MTPLRRFAVGDVALSKDDPLSVDLKMSPLPPVATNTSGFADEVVLSVLEVELSSDFAHEETSTAMLTINTNQDNILFTLFLHRKCCKIKTGHLHVTSIGLFYKKVVILLGRCFRQFDDCQTCSVVKVWE